MTLKEGSRVRLINDNTAVGSIVSMDGARAVVLFDGYAASNSVALDSLEPKRGRTPGTIGPVPEPVPEVKLECILREVVRERMAAHNMSWSVLAARSGLSKSTIARIMKADPAKIWMGTAAQVAIGLGIDDPGVFWRKVS